MKHRLTAISSVFLAAAAATVAYAGDDMTSLSYISYLERSATLRTARDAETLDAVVNMPVLAGDRLETTRGARVEVQLADGSTVWLDEYSTLDFDSLAYSRDTSATRTALFLVEGTAAIEIPSSALGEGRVRFESPAGAVYLNRPGFYRLDLDKSQIHVSAFTGLAELPEGYGSSMLRSGQEAWFENGGDIEKASLNSEYDDFWNWVEERRHPPTSRSAQYVDSRYAARAAILDSYGEWVYVSTFSSWMWRPHVGSDWVPYSCGRWVFTPAGWTWVAYEPWGWYPSHYGSWYFDASFGWCWGWDSVWGPAWVHWIYTDGYVGWCARGYYDWWYWHSYHNYYGDGSRGYSWPSRWSQTALDFSGRVRLRDIDPKPWNLVPTGQFTSAHLERVRLEPSRLLRDLPPDRLGVVRSGALLTPGAGRTRLDRDIESAFRDRPPGRDLRDISTVLGRERGGNGGTRSLPIPDLKPIRTGDILPRTVLPSDTGAARGRNIPDRGRLDRFLGGNAGGDDEVVTRRLGRTGPDTTRGRGQEPPDRFTRRDRGGEGGDSGTRTGNDTRRRYVPPTDGGTNRGQDNDRSRGGDTERRRHDPGSGPSTPPPRTEHRDPPPDHSTGPRVHIQPAPPTNTKPSDPSEASNWVRERSWSGRHGSWDNGESRRVERYQPIDRSIGSRWERPSYSPPPRAEVRSYSPPSRVERSFSPPSTSHSSPPSAPSRSNANPPSFSAHSGSPRQR